MTRRAARSSVPDLRLRDGNAAPARARGEHVLYWMTAARRLTWSFALDRAVALARELDRPLLVLEALRCDYPHASARLHRFVLDGMADNARRCAAAGVTYLPYVEPAPGAGRGLLAALGRRACVVVGDDRPGLFYPRMLAAAGARLDCRLELVDGNGLLPLRAADRAHPTAHGFRRCLQRALPAHLGALPAADPLAARLRRARPVPDDVARRWPAAADALLAGDAAALAALPVDGGVPVVAGTPGGEAPARARLRAFLEERLARYAEERDDPDADVCSGLSPYLHFGHLSPHEALAALAEREGWTPDAVSARADGRRAGWWGMSPSAEAWLDQLVTWRELGLNVAHHAPATHDRYESVPAWARTSLEAHAADAREWTYSRRELEQARTHDPLWNAAQRQLLREGTIHTYLRMLWGKKVLEWSRTPRQAFRALVHLNDRWALDGRDPSSYTGIAWCFGRHDRPWPEREVFGVVRCMSSESARRKLRLRGYLARYGPAPARR